MKLSFLLDTSTCIPVLRNQASLGKLPDPALFCKPRVIVAAELWTGVKKNLQTHPQQAARLEGVSGVSSSSLNSISAALHYAEIRAALESAGTSIGPLGLLIAAKARSLRATIVTANAGEFKQVKGLKVQAWK
ncbi:MAG: hypothetical protein IPL39_18625 [Opitutaceae bacterium]|nr:hypothetical protein [Opitutaceae bacterium]